MSSKKTNLVTRLKAVAPCGGEHRSAFVLAPHNICALRFVLDCLSHHGACAGCRGFFPFLVWQAPLDGKVECSILTKRGTGGTSRHGTPIPESVFPISGARNGNTKRFGSSWSFGLFFGCCTVTAFFPPPSLFSLLPFSFHEQ